MSESKHTPGPWHAGGYRGCDIFDQENRIVASALFNPFTRFNSAAQMRPNAFLIAAAPDGLELAKAVLAAASAGGTVHTEPALVPYSLVELARRFMKAAGPADRTEPFEYECGRCNGTGAGDGIRNRCPDCKGSGKLVGRRKAAEPKETP